MNHLEVPIGVSHISSRLQEIQSREWEKKEQTNNKAWVNSSARRASLWHCIPCRLTLACISSEISTNHGECWLILTSLPSLLLDSISYRLVSLLSGIDCRLPFIVSLRQLLPLSSFFQLLTGVPLSTSSRVEISSSGLCLVSRQNRQRDRLLSRPPT